MLIHFSRVSGALLGGYAFTWSFSALGITALLALGVGFHEAETAILMTAFPVFLILFLWAFAVTSVKLIWLVLMIGAAAMSSGAYLLQRFLQG